MKISVVRKAKVEGAWRFLPVWKQDGRYDWAKLKYKDLPIVTVEGTFYLDYTEGKRVRRAVGDHARDAKIALSAQTSIVNLRLSGVQVEDAPQMEAYRPVSGPRIDAVVRDFKANPPVGLRRTSRSKYNNALSSFLSHTSKTHLVQLDRRDIAGFMSYMVNEEELDASTAKDKAIIVLSQMNRSGAVIKMEKGEWPKVTERQPSIYAPATLKALFARANSTEFAIFQTFLMTGFRDQELGFLSWDDFNPTKATLSVTKKKALGFDPKTYQERTIPVPDRLVEILKAHRKLQGAGEYLIFPTSRDHNKTRGCPGGQRDKHVLDMLKKLAMRAGLNCGGCKGNVRGKSSSCAVHPMCKKFGLHRFRHTYATTLLRDGVDLVSLQSLMGHADMDSTRKYLRCLEPEDLREKIRGTTLSTAFCN